MKIFLDTNIWLRFFVKDNSQSQVCEQLIDAIEQGAIQAYTSSLVFLEAFYVLTSPAIYRHNKVEAMKKIETVSSLRGLTLCEECDFAQATKLFANKKMKFADCLIATQVPQGVTLCTYDREFTKIKNLKITTPAEVLKKFKK